MLQKYASQRPNYGTFFTFRCTEEKPLEFEDIVDRETYDKMRPPKPGGINLLLIIVSPCTVL